MYLLARSLSLAAPLAIASLPASAAPQCGSHDAIVKVLLDKYNESRRVMGIINARAVMEMFTSPMAPGPSW